MHFNLFNIGKYFNGCGNFNAGYGILYYQPDSVDTAGFGQTGRFSHYIFFFFRLSFYVLYLY